LPFQKRKEVMPFLGFFEDPNWKFFTHGKEPFWGLGQ
jgi:hypothetical protein